MLRKKSGINNSENFEKRFPQRSESDNETVFLGYAKPLAAPYRGKKKALRL